MAVQTIPPFPYEPLRSKCAPVTQDDINDPSFQEFIQNLIDTLRKKGEDGAGLAAPQIGVEKRIFVTNIQLDNGAEITQVFINPQVEWISEETEQDWEGCLSFPDQWALVTRPIKARVSALNRTGKPFEIEGQHFYARLLQHEIDHLNGVLFIDKKESEIIDTTELHRIVDADEQREAVG